VDLASWTIGLRSLVRLRWGAALGQIAAVILARVLLDPTLPLLPLGALVVATGATNVALLAVLSRLPGAEAGETRARRVLVGTLVLDVLILTGLLLGSGGASNPFSVFYLVEVALAALLVTPRAAWGLAILSSLAFGSLFLLPAHEVDPHAKHHMASPLHLQGMWIAYTLAAGFVAHFVTRVASALRARDAELRTLELAKARSDRLASLTTLAAGAAHELGSPLGTIAVVARELERRAASLGDGAMEGDARLVRQEVDRCRGILRRMSAAEAPGEAPAPTSLAELGARVLRAMGDDAARVHVDAGADTVLVPGDTLAQAVANLARNGVEAQRVSGAAEPVELRARVEGGRLVVTITDHGTGFPPEIAARVGEPFFTTKREGEGMGLGVFLARTVAEQLGGSLELRALRAGSEARLELPANVVRA
jgi:two-component system sensor histidine kinase RegB